MHTPMQIQKKILKLSKQTNNQQNKSCKSYSNSPTLKSDIVLNVQNIKTMKDKRTSLIVDGAINLP